MEWKFEYFNYNDSVKVLDTAPPCYYPGEIGALISEWSIPDKESSEKYNLPIGTVLCLVEFQDHECQIPLQYLKLMDR